jgi:glutathione S-transferase
MIALHHNAASTCSQKVRLALAEKQLDYQSHDVDLIGGAQHDPDYVKLNPNHVVPTLVHDGGVFIESTVINEYLDDAFPDPPLRPADAAGRHAMRLWTKRIDELHPNAGVLTYAIGTRPMLMQRSPQEIEAHVEQLPDPKKREQRRSVIEHGVAAPEFGGAMRAFEHFLDQMQVDLSQRTWLAGDLFSLADAAALPYVMRLDHLAMTPIITSRPKVVDWYARVQERPSFEIAVSSLLPQFVIDMFRKNGAAVWADVEPLTREA